MKTLEELILRYIDAELRLKEVKDQLHEIWRMENQRMDYYTEVNKLLHSEHRAYAKLNRAKQALWGKDFF